jgi:hypothetical protein
MLGRWIALAVWLGMAASVRADPPSPCELARSDRTRTPSSRCLGCHDGSAGSTLGPSHPVEVDYATASARSPGRYVPAALLPAEVTLVAGRVACVSCHAQASPHPKRAVEPATLCTACHRL